MRRGVNALSISVLLLAGCSGGGGAQTGGHGDAGGDAGSGCAVSTSSCPTSLDAALADAEDDTGGAMGNDSAGALDGAEAADGAGVPFQVYPPEIQWSGSAGFGASHTITVTALVDLTELSASLSSGSPMVFANHCPAGLASGQSWPITVTTCPAGTYSSHQESGEVVIRAGGGPGHSATVPVHASCSGS